MTARTLSHAIVWIGAAVFWFGAGLVSAAGAACMVFADEIAGAVTKRLTPRP